MAKILVLYHSMYGHIETMANAVAEGARRVPGAEVVIKRVPETMPEDAFRNAGGKVDQAADIADPNELPNYDAIIFGTPTRFGNMSDRCATSSTAPAACGPRAHCMAKSRAYSPPRAPVAGRK